MNFRVLHLSFVVDEGLSKNVAYKARRESGALNACTGDLDASAGFTISVAGFMALIAVGAAGFGARACAGLRGPIASRGRSLTVTNITDKTCSGTMVEEN
ncbi:uncharacterized protein N7515_000919 [Penicillium bovifimosum]|uniref:Uncharacterized protein n=1 Tax=Penicillium bovifimosum TaxID=126998 RepID=A0A9W9HIG0_9EURO|nr:uncharacterized protein N7515_000919 [Penicillium bovifimosum]KAJ5146355.1 hypothetical protein N7515_000919 [Penicillium bovifimosum]